VNPCITRVISEHFTGYVVATKSYINPCLVTLLVFGCNVLLSSVVVTSCVFMVNKQNMWNL